MSAAPRILLAPDKFKGSLSAEEVCRAVEAGLSQIWPEATFDHCPVADGGDGTCDAVANARRWDWVECSTQDALGRSTVARYLFDEVDRLALIEMSAASGMTLVSDLPKNPALASTFGVGELILDASKRGAEKIFVGLGGSATNDGGTGMAEALGWKFLDRDGQPVTGLPARLEDVVAIEPPESNLDAKIVAACDVDNPLLGPSGATSIYGPQKGVTPNEIPVIEARLSQLSDVVNGTFHEKPGAGAAGGLGFGLLAFADACLQPGFDLVSDLLDLPSRIESADLVVTGEGSFDRQTLDHGKAPARILELAAANQLPALVVSGRVDLRNDLPSDVISISCMEAGLPEAESIGRASELIERLIKSRGDEIRALVAR